MMYKNCTLAQNNFMAKKKYTYPKGGNMRIELSKTTHKKLWDKAKADGRELKPFIERFLDETKP